MSKGFTFIELLVVITIFGVMGVIFSDFLIQTFRGENKINATVKVKQTGQLVLDKISNDIRQAEEVLCVGGSGAYSDNTLIVFKSGNYFRYRLIPEDISGAANGYITTDSFTADDYPVINSSLCSAAMSARSFYLSDIDPISGVSVKFDGIEPIFKLSTVGGTPNITIAFRVLAAVNSGETYDVEVSENGVLFKTAVQVRGVKQ